MSLLREIQRRKVFKAAAFYLVVAWLLIQVAATIAPMMSLPDFAPRLVLYLLIILFPVALFLAWAYEITPDGIRADAGPAAEQASPSPHTNLLSMLFVGLVLFAGVALYFYNRPDNGSYAVSASPAAGPEQPSIVDKSIAVLPFTAFSSDADDQFFADGLSDTLLNNLAQLSDIKVISRSSAFQYRGDAVDVRQVGEDLRVATVLEGSVQRSGDRLRIIAQLIETRTGAHLWSETFDRSGDDIFAIQDQISAAVVENLELSLSPEERERLQATGTQSVEAYNLLTYISERAQANQPFEMSTAAYKEDQYFWINETKRVLEIDPEYAEAYRFIAGRYSGLLFQASSTSDTEYHLRKGFEAVNKAMLLEPDNPRNFALFASMSRRAGNDDTAEAFARMAYARLPNDPETVRNLSLALMGQNKNPAEILALVDLEESLDPTSTNLYRRKMFALERLGRFEEAVDVIRSELESTQQPQLAAGDLADVLSSDLGRQVEAMRALIDMRTSLEDRVGDVLLDGWLSMAAVLGLTEQLDEVLPRIEGENLKTLYSSIAIAERGNLGGAESRLRAFTDASPVDLANYWATADLCILLEDYVCAVQHLVARQPELDTRNGREPALVELADFEAAVHLARSFEQLGDSDAAQRLLQAAKQWYESRAVDGYMYSQHYYLPELFLMLGDKERAIALIRQRIMLDDDSFIAQCEFCSFTSSLYDSVRDDPEFQRLTAEYERRKAAAAATVRAMIADSGY